MSKVKESSDGEELPLINQNGSSKSSPATLKQRAGAIKEGTGPSQTLIAGACFCLASGSMTLLNKAALSGFNFKVPDALLFFQCALAVVLVRIFAAVGIVKLEPFSWRIARVWYPVNVIFVCMIATSFWALKDLGVPMSTVLKNMTNLIVIIAEYIFYGRTYNAGIWATLGLMILSALCSAYTDLSFSASGYFWQIVNAGFTAANMLYLKVVMEKVAKYTSTGAKLDEFSMVFYNNLLSLPLILGLMIVRGELGEIVNQPDLYNPAFLAVATLSGLVGFAISFCVLWFLSTTTPTTFSLVGSLNKIPVSFIGLLLFDSAWSLPNLASMAVGMVSGVMFVIAKQRANG